MKYFKNPEGEVFGYDETDTAQLALMNEQTKGWTDITSSWPPTPAVVPASPDTDGFWSAVKDAMGGIVGLNALTVAYPLIQSSLFNDDWADLQALIEAAVTANAILATQLTTIKSAVTSHNIPITLV